MGLDARKSVFVVCEQQRRRPACTSEVEDLLKIKFLWFVFIPDPGNVVCYCSVGYRSCMVAQKLESLFKNQGMFDPITGA